MQDLRLVGVHDDGEHLLLSGDFGETYRLRIDEALRIASSRTAVRPSARTSKQKSKQSPETVLAPRDIQARIRAGATAEEVAAESGMEIAHILRYEGPVMAERDYMAHQARTIEVTGPVAGHDGYRSAFGDDPATLGEMVSHRLKAFGVDASNVEWDSWRRPDGSWEVVARFELVQDSKVDVGEEPPAKWIFSPTRKTVTNANRWAQVLSELEPLDGPLPSRRLAAVSDRVFDFETDAAPEETQAQDKAEDIDSNNLLDVLRSRRGQRLGADEDGDDALASMLAKGSIPAAHPRDGLDGIGNDGDGLAPAAKQQFGGLSLAPSSKASKEPDGLPQLHDGVSTATREITIIARPQTGETRADDQPTDAGTDEAGTSAGPEDSGKTDASEAGVDQSGSAEPGADASARASESAPRPENTKADGTQQHGKSPASQPNERRQFKPKRSSVPSWDDILLGKKGD